MVSPLFLLSLPRSGSTLLQRILGRHEQIATGPEPTFLLPLFHLVDDAEVVATYDHHFTSWAVSDFFDVLGDDGFRDTVRRWASDAYERAAVATGSGEARYFLDKTPKYHQIADEIVATFDQAPVIVLWRNPLAVVASMMTTWRGGRWNLEHFRLDLYDGLPRLVDVVRRHGDDIITVRYEDLVADPEREGRRLFDRLGLGFEERTLDDFASVELVGRVQDPNVATEGFRAVRTDRVDSWTQVLSNPLRRRWCRRYLDWLGDDRLAVMGYDREVLLGDLEAVPASTQHLASDLVRLPFDFVFRWMEIGVFAKKLRRGGARRGPVLAHK